MSREAMKLALDALVFAAYEDIEYDDACDQKVREARNALRQALSQPEQEPVAWISEGGDVSRSKRYMDEMGFKCNPLYTAPPKKQWVGLTLNEAEDFYEKYTDRAELINAIDKFLEEKNT
jgi:hypothetical protein